MATSFTLGSQTFAALGQAANRYALAIFIDSAVYDNIRIHVKGADGNFMIRGGKSGGKIRAFVRYTAAGEESAESQFEADCAAFANAAIQIVRGGNTLPRCNLDPGGGRKLKAPKPMGDSTGNAFLDAEFNFTQDA